MAFAGVSQPTDIYLNWHGISLSGSGGQPYDGDPADRFRLEPFLMSRERKGDSHPVILDGLVVGRSW